MARKASAALLALSIGILVTLSAPGAGMAFTLQCVDREAIFDRLKERQGEVPAHAGVASSGALFEVLVGPEGSWTAFFTFPDGLTCPVATGEGWRDAPAIDDDPAA